MNNRTLFMIIDNQVKFLSDNNMDHREWYNSLGLDINNYENIIRGFIMDNKIVFFKGSMFSYGDDVINAAKVYTPSIRHYLNINYPVYCGIIISQYDNKWEPVVQINENEITGFVQKPVEVKKEKEHIETGPVIEFKNNYEDPKFIKIATIVSSIVLILVVIIKIMLFSKNEVLQLTSIFDILLTLSQIGTLVFTIYGYNKKITYTKYIGVLSSILIILTLDIFDIIVGVLYFIFSIDQGYFIKLTDLIKKIFNKKSN